VEVTSTNIDAATGTARTVRTEYKGTVDDFRRVILQPLDVVRFRPVFSDRQEGRVTITGEVRYPGTFDVKRGERLSSVLARAGGLTEEAYAPGAIFTRRTAAIAESEANQREAKELQVALAAAAQRGSFTSNISGASVAGAAGAAGSNSSDVVNNLIAELRAAPALGRITVTADPAVLQVRPEQDIAMEGGDTLYIPKRPSTVTVTGEVLNTGSFAYPNDLTVRTMSPWPVAHAKPPMRTAPSSCCLTEVRDRLRKAGCLSMPLISSHLDQPSWFRSPWRRSTS